MSVNITDRQRSSRLAYPPGGERRSLLEEKIWLWHGRGNNTCDDEDVADVGVGRKTAQGKLGFRVQKAPHRIIDPEERGGPICVQR